MREVVFEKGMVFENDTYYIVKENLYDIYLEDCVVTRNPVYFSYTNTKEIEHSVGFLLKNLKNVTIDFNNATLVFHGRIVPFILDNCENVKLINFKLDYDRPFYTQAKVFECDTTHMKIRIDDGFDYRVDNGFLFVTSETWEKKLNKNDCLLWLFDRTGEKSYPIILSLFGPEIFPNENPALPIGQILIEVDGEFLILKGNFPDSWEFNDGKNSLLFTHEIRDKCTITFVDCKDLYIENFTLLHGAAYALMGLNTENIYIDNFSMFMDYEGNGRLVTNNADGVHLFNCKGNFVLKNSYMDGLLDDTVNIHNNYLTIDRIDENKIYCKSQGASVDVYCPLFVEGDEIAVYQGKSQTLKEKFVIRSVSLDETSKTFMYELNGDPCRINRGDIIENLSGQPEILIENCVFGRFRGTMRLQSSSKTVLRNCKFKNEIVSILFTGDTTYWFESGPVNDFLIDNCSFYNTKNQVRLCFEPQVEFTEKENYYHKNITVKNCYFDEGNVAYLSHVDNFIFEDNFSTGQMTLLTNSCGKIICDKNVVIKEHK